MKSQEGGKKTPPFLFNEVLKKKGGLCVFSNKWGSSTENNAGGIVIDRKRKVKGVFIK